MREGKDGRGIRIEPATLEGAPRLFESKTGKKLKLEVTPTGDDGP